MSELYKLLEDFLVKEETDQSPYWKSRLLANAYARRGSNHYSRQVTKRLIDELEKSDSKTASTYLELFQLKSNWFSNLKTLKYKSEEKSIEEVMLNLDLFYFNTKLKMANELLNRQKALSSQYDILLLEEVKVCVQNLPAKYKNPLMIINLRVIELWEKDDPNIKSTNPKGIGQAHEIDKDWHLGYTIEFQNTGNDTAFFVVVKDTLSENLDLTTLRVAGASHPFTWALNPGRELVFTFENILLPDSTTNEPESHGFFSFSIYPKSELLHGDLIENQVGIYFDFNDLVITNTVFHTIRKPVVASSEHIDWCAGEEFMGQEIWQDTSFQLLTEFVEYDSIHFVHLAVTPQSQDSVFIEIEIGNIFENTLILGDTTFTIIYSDQNLCDSLVTYTVDGLTSLDEDKIFKNTKVYPNPANNFLFVINHQNNENQAWELINNLGIVVWKKQLNTNESLPEISTIHLPVGVYWLQVKTDTATAVWKVIKQ